MATRVSPANHRDNWIAHLSAALKSNDSAQIAAANQIWPASRVTGHPSWCPRRWNERGGVRDRVSPPPKGSWDTAHFPLALSSARKLPECSSRLWTLLEKREETTLREKSRLWTKVEAGLQRQQTEPGICLAGHGWTFASHPVLSSNAICFGDTDGQMSQLNTRPFWHVQDSAVWTRPTLGCVHPVSETR